MEQLLFSLVAIGKWGKSNILRIWWVMTAGYLYFSHVCQCLWGEEFQDLLSFLFSSQIQAFPRRSAALLQNNLIFFLDNFQLKFTIKSTPQRWDVLSPHRRRGRGLGSLPSFRDMGQAAEYFLFHFNSRRDSQCNNKEVETTLILVFNFK